jgi:hypothetical protein
VTEEQGLPTWITQGKTIRQLITELQSFDDLDAEVYVSVDEGITKRPISMIGMFGGQCTLVYLGGERREPS